MVTSDLALELDAVGVSVFCATVEDGLAASFDVDNTPDARA